MTPEQFDKLLEALDAIAGEISELRGAVEGRKRNER